MLLDTCLRIYKNGFHNTAWGSKTQHDDFCMTSQHTVWSIFMSVTRQSYSATAEYRTMHMCDVICKIGTLWKET